MRTDGDLIQLLNHQCLVVGPCDLKGLRGEQWFALLRTRNAFLHKFIFIWKGGHDM